MSSDEERAALSFGILVGYVAGAILVYTDAGTDWWVTLIGLQVLIVAWRFWRAFG